MLLKNKKKNLYPYAMKNNKVSTQPEIVAGAYCIDRRIAYIEKRNE